MDERPTGLSAAGDLVVLDFGGVYDGYCVDLTRTVALRRPRPKRARVHDAVAEAQAGGHCGRSRPASARRT